MVEKVFENPGFYFQWHFLEECNLKCKHCYQKGNARNKTLSGKSLLKKNFGLYNNLFDNEEE